MSAHTQAKVTALTVTADTYAQCSERRREALAKSLASDVRAFVTAKVSDDTFDLDTFGAEFVATFGTEADTARDVEFARFVQQRHTIAVRTTVEALAKSGALAQGRTAKVSQRALAKSLHVSQPRISQILAKYTEREAHAAQVREVTEAAKVAGLIPVGSDDTTKDEAKRVREAIREAVTNDPAEALAQVNAKRVPIVAPKAATLAQVAAIVAKVEALTVGGVTVEASEREQARRLAATLRGLADMIHATPKVMAKSA